ncbi:kinase-like protein, partial [Peniophora sp. CONT]
DFVGSSLDKGKYKVTGFLGRGTSGAVIYRVSEGEGEYAVKRVDTRADAPEWSTKNEHMLHSFVSEHPHVLSYHGFFTDAYHTHLLTSVCEGGRLCDFVDESPLFWRNDETIRKVFLSIVRAVRHCHSRGIAHRDICPENVLSLDMHGDTFVLADFGKATTEKKSKQFGLGLAAYSAPECTPGESNTTYDTRIADVWSLGILLLYMVAGATPWTAPRASHAAYTSFLSEPIHLQRILPVSGDLVALLARVLDPRPKRRMSIGELERAVVVMRSFSMSDAELAL